MARRTGNHVSGTRPAAGATGLRPVRPVEVRVPAAEWRVRAVIPCHNRPRDAELLLNDLAVLAAGEPTIDLSVLLVDNASAEPLTSLAIPVGVRVEHLRLDVNTGGSGGFNAGMARVLSRGIPADAREFIWLLDSDARVSPATLRPLVRALEDHDDVIAVGSALADESGEVFEVGGRVCRRTGEWAAAPRADRHEPPVVHAEYAAACSLLVRRWAVERAGLMADAFVGGDRRRVVPAAGAGHRRRGRRRAAVHRAPPAVRPHAHVVAVLRGPQHVPADRGAGLGADGPLPPRDARGRAGAGSGDGRARRPGRVAPARAGRRRRRPNLGPRGGARVREVPPARRARRRPPGVALRQTRPARDARA